METYNKKHLPVSSQNKISKRVVYSKELQQKFPLLKSQKKPCSKSVNSVYGGCRDKKSLPYIKSHAHEKEVKKLAIVSPVPKSDSAYDTASVKVLNCLLKQGERKKQKVKKDSHRSSKSSTKSSYEGKKYAEDSLEHSAYSSSSYSYQKSKGRFLAVPVSISQWENIPTVEQVKPSRKAKKRAKQLAKKQQIILKEKKIKIGSESTKSADIMNPSRKRVEFKLSLPKTVISKRVQLVKGHQQSKDKYDIKSHSEKEASVFNQASPYYCSLTSDPKWNFPVTSHCDNDSFQPSLSSNCVPCAKVTCSVPMTKSATVDISSIPALPPSRKRKKKHNRSSSSTLDSWSDMLCAQSPIAKCPRSSSHMSSVTFSTPIAQNTTLGHSLEEAEYGDVEMVDVSTDLQSLEVLNDMQVENPSPNSESYYVVIDTSVLMQEVKVVDELKETPLMGCGPPHIFIPWVVIQELDGLKSRSDKTRYKASEAVRYLFNMLNSRHPRFHGQTAKMAANCLKIYDLCNDDVILGCCLQLAERMPKERIILLSNDINLCNKALISGITACTASSIRNMLKNEFNASHEKQNAVKQAVAEVNETKEIATVEDKKKQEEVDYILCEARMLLKFVFEPLMQEEMEEAFGDMSIMFLPEQPRTVSDILQCYKKYWLSVFGLKLPNQLLKSFEHLEEVFGISKGRCPDANSALNTLKVMEDLCKELLFLRPEIEPSLKRISVLIEQCRMLNHETKAEMESIANETVMGSTEIVLSVFNHIWDLINHFCGFIMDFLGISHNLVYARPERMASKVEFQLLLANMYPCVLQLKKGMSKVSGSSGANEKDVKSLYNNLLQFVPSLQIQAPPPPTDHFSIKELKSFFSDPNNGEIIRNGICQLEHFYSKLNECAHHPDLRK